MWINVATQIECRSQFWNMKIGKEVSLLKSQKIQRKSTIQLGQSRKQERNENDDILWICEVKNQSGISLWRGSDL